MPESRSPRHAAAALHRVAMEGGSAVSAPAREAFLRKFEDQVDPDRVLPSEERAKRASAAHRAHFLNLAAKSADVRRLRADARERDVEVAELRALVDAIEQAS